MQSRDVLLSGTVRLYLQKMAYEHIAWLTWHTLGVGEVENEIRVVPELPTTDAAISQAILAFSMEDDEIASMSLEVTVISGHVVLRATFSEPGGFLVLKRRVAELSTAMPRAGGTYYFLHRSLGPMAGTIGVYVALFLSEDRRWGLAAQDEIFLNFNSPTNGPQAGFDQNRFFLGVNRRVNDYVAIDAGYQIQVVENDEPGFPNGVNHVFLIQFFFNN